MARVGLFVARVRAAKGVRDPKARLWRLFAAIGAAVCLGGSVVSVGLSLAAAPPARAASGVPCNHYFDVSAPSTATAGSAFNFTVTVRDACTNEPDGAQDTIHFTSSDAKASLPGDYTNNVIGPMTFSATLNTPGPQTITANDTSNDPFFNGMGTSNTITVRGPPTHLAVSATFAAGTSSATAGLGFNVTVTAQDAANNTVTDYRGTVHFTSTAGQASLPADYTFTAADAGTHTFSATLNTLGNQTITATDTANGSIAGTSNTITVSPATAATHLAVSAPFSASTGSRFNVTVTALDSSNNAVGYGDTVHFTSTDGGASLPADYTFTAADAGTHTFSAALNTVGNETITATDTNAGITGTSNAITVRGASSLFPTHLAVSAPSTATPGSPFNFTVTALDQNNNTSTGYAGNSVHLTSTDGAAVLPADYTFTAADAGIHTFSATLKTAGSQTITADDPLNPVFINGTSDTITVRVPSSIATHLAVSATSSATAGLGFNVTVTAQDEINRTATGYLGTVHFTSTGGQASLPGDYTFTAADAGTHTFSVTLPTAGGQTITATDTANGSITGTSNTITVSPSTAATHFAVSGSPSSIVSGSAFNFTVTAQDGSNATATDYRRTVHFTSTDGQASLPADYTFTAADGGTHTFSATLNTAGSQTITATDTANAGITGTSNTIAVSVPGGPATHLAISAPSTATAGSAFNVTVTALDSSNRTASGYLGEALLFSTDGQASLPGVYHFTAADAGTHTFSVTLKTAGSQTIGVEDAVHSFSARTNAITVSPAAATHFSVSAPSTATPSSAFNFTVTAQDAYSNTATGYGGTVHFSSTDGGATLPADSTLTNGAGTFSATLINPGSQSITATDTTNSSITGTQSGIVVGKLSQAITFTSPPPSNATVGGPTYPVTATGGASTSPVTFGVDPSASSVCSIAAPNTVSFTGAGTCVIDANQAGDANYNAAPQAQQSFTVKPAPLTVTANNQTKQFGAAVPPLTATVSGFVNGQTLSSSGVTGSASCSTTATASSPGGTYPITCTQGSLRAGNYVFTTFNPGTLTVAFAKTITGTSSGQLSVRPGQPVLLGPGSVVTGPVTIQPGGSLEADGATITGPVKASGAATIRLCHANVTGPTTFSGTRGPVVLGDDDGAAACAGNKFGGPVSITKGTGGVEFDRNTVTGPLTITGNTGTLSAPDTGAVDATQDTVIGPSNVQTH